MSREAVDLQSAEALAVPEAATAGLTAAPKSPYVEVELAALPNPGRTTVTSRVRARRVARGWQGGCLRVLLRVLLREGSVGLPAPA